MERKELIRTIYLYLFSFIGLVLIITGVVRLVDLGLKVYVFTKADEVVIYPYSPSLDLIKENSDKDIESIIQEQEKYRQQQIQFEKEDKIRQRHRAVANSLAFIIVGLPLFIYHWLMIQREKRG